MNTFSASAHYADWNGRIMGDNDDLQGIRSFVQRNGLLMEGELLVGIEFYQGKTNNFSLYGLAIAHSDYDSVKAALDKLPDPLKLRKFLIPLSRDGFFSLFERFSMVLQPRGLGLIDREIDTDL